MHHSPLHLAVSESANVQAMPIDIPHASDVLLVTAWVNFHTAEGCCVKVRALFDQGSTLSFISESLCWTSRTTRQCADLQVCFGKNYTGHTRSKIVLGLTPYNISKPMFPLTAYVFKNLTSYIPSAVQPPEWWPHLRGLPLADPNPTSREPIHLLVRADLYRSLLLRDLRQGPLGTPMAQKTEFS
ncbi:hypothetical protein HN011_001242 [Eciton burchellii]|nr:hypothetical protein HN011_001242 [Eciton burchellii]